MQFVMFLVLAVAVYYLTPKRYRWVTLLVVNYVFYYFAGVKYFVYLLATTISTYIATTKLGNMAAENKAAYNAVKAELDRDAWKADFTKKKRRVLVPTLVFNFGILAVLKYSGFVSENLNALFAKISAPVELPVFHFLLPLGISFYTFQTMSYTIDVYRKDAPVQRNMVDFGAFVTMFPQLIAGPIVQYKTVAADLRHRLHTSENFALGARRFCVGLAKKVLLANSIGALWEDCLAAQGAGTLTVLGGWLGLAAYGFQIYFDFSGYSDMAIGLGRIFGFRFNENFDHPYCADSVGTFWRRWHMSLTSWFRDYLYIPLGGNRGGTARTIRNLLIVWFCTGFWHGASWNFILWGLYFAAWLILERYVLRGVLEKTPAILKHLYTLIVVFVGWGLFAMVDLGVCGDYLAACFGGAPLWSGADLFRLRSYAVTLAVLVLASTALGQRLWAKLPRQAEQLATPVLMGLSLVVCTAYLVDGSYNPFLYFRF